MKNRISYLSAPYVVWMGFFVVAPIVLMVFYAFTTAEGEFTMENFVKLSGYGVIFSRSFQLALIATLICLVVGYPIACILAREGVSFQRLAMILIMLPMWINFILRTYAWMSLLENTGIINTFLANIGFFALFNSVFGTDIEYFRMINTQGAVVLGMVYNYLPFMILPIYSVIIKQDTTLNEAAHDLGADGMTVFRRVIFPLSLPGVLSGITMVFVPSVSTFAISQMLGGGTSMLLGDLIELQFRGGAYNPQLGSAIALVMMLVVVICMAVMNRFGEGEEQAVNL